MINDLEIQKYLRLNNGGYAKLEAELGITNHRHPKYPELIQFCYDTIESAKYRSHPIVRECRGIILNEADDYAVVAYPFQRFFNDGELCADQIDWSTARVQEKLDGSLMILYYYDNKWQVATKGSPDAGGPVGDHKFTFAELFWSACEYWLKGLCRSGHLHKDSTYMVELTSPWNRIVCDYQTTGMVMCKSSDPDGESIEIEMNTTGYCGTGCRLTLVGYRDHITGAEVTVSHFAHDWHYVVQEYPLTSLEEVIEASLTIDATKQEGYVIVDGNFNRLKVKSPKYIALHHMVDKFGRRRVIDLIKLGETSEVVAYFPQYKPMFEEIESKFNKMVAVAECAWIAVNNTVGPNATQKEFALEALKYDKPTPACLFQLRSGKVKSVREALCGMQTVALDEMIG